ncbi:DNA oxidative demethylase AlkB [Nitrincola tapanii]|uniref:DNA oxidative demethylase AlkB n=1 Tax=Nitrincola tapanii TaxID=1708751 RepID=A0A5A9W4S3_9GAMM|nr:DNA oxidative demethylase AlkB [Nitrincola tapanii]KAA0875776.1 DNA oxidative demethylase AlkB [Nitrincola tapanii]
MTSGGHVQDLFSDPIEARLIEQKSAGTWLLKSWLAKDRASISVQLQAILQVSPLRRFKTPNGYSMSVGSSNCGAWGWISDQKGYRYSAVDPLTQRPWPAMPEAWQHLATEAAELVGFQHFIPDSCLINCYEVGDKMGLHQDKDEEIFEHPIVSVSLGLPIIFMLGGLTRSQAYQKILLEDSDVLIWGGVDRLKYHGVQSLRKGLHPIFGSKRYNLTFRKAK